jgi:hypothetical protein
MSCEREQTQEHLVQASRLTADGQKIWAGSETMKSQPNTPNERRSSATERSSRPQKPVRAGVEREIKT